MPQDRYQTVLEIAERLEVAEATIRHWIKSGELRAIDIGKGWRIADTDLERFLKVRETAPREKDGTTASTSADEDG
jgi:excisionase family DNA binding protein